MVTDNYYCYRELERNRLSWRGSTTRMPEIAQQDSVRERLLALFRSNDIYRFLNAFEAQRDACAADGELWAAGVQAYVRLGLRSPAERLLDAGAVDAALRERLRAQLPARDPRLPWSRYSQRFERNLEAFDRRTGLGKAVGEAWRERVRRLQLLQTSDGNEQVLDVSGEQPCWRPALLPHRTLCDVNRLRAQWSRHIISPLVLNGIGTGYAALGLIAASEKTLLDFSAPVIVFEPSLVGWAVALHLHDWSDALSLDRVRACGGTEAWASLRAELRAVAGTVPKILATGAWTDEAADARVVSFAETVVGETREERRARLVALRQARAERDAGFWAARFAEALGGAGPPLRVLGITSRFTTVLQYSMRDWLASFEELGCETKLFTEANESAYFSAPHIQALIESHDPDLIVIIDHLLGEYQDVFPPEIPSICWIQDQLPHLFDTAAGKSVRGLEFVVGHGFPECLTRFGYPSDRFLPCGIPTNPEALLDPCESEDDLAPYRCDVMYASNASTPPEVQFARFRERLPEIALPLVDAAHAQLLAAAQSDSFCGDHDFWGLLERAERDTRITVSNHEQRSEVVLALRNVADQILRERSIRAAAEWADATGGRFHLYGRGWEQRPEYARFARGVVAHGVPLGRAFRAATISLHMGCNDALHQRVLDGLCAGGFFLVHEKPTDGAHEINKAILSHVGSSGLKLPTRIRPSDLPEPHASDFAHVLRVRGSVHEEGVPFTFEDLLKLKAECELGVCHRASGVWGRFGEATYRTPAELGAKIDHYRAHPEDRESLRLEMREAVLQRFTYKASTDRMLRFVWGALRRMASTGQG